MKHALAGLLLLFTPNIAWATGVLANAKIARVVGVIDQDLADTFIQEMAATTSIDGDRLIVISSPGGQSRRGTG